MARGVGHGRHALSRLVTRAGSHFAEVVAVVRGRLDTMASEQISGAPLAHVVVAGGTPLEWLEMSSDLWQKRLDTLLAGTSAGGVRWITLLPHHGEPLSEKQRALYCEQLGVNKKDTARKISVMQVSHGERYLLQDDSGRTIIIDPSPDGHQRFAATVESLRLAGVDPDGLSEERLSHYVLQPAEIEPDLVVILGPPDLIPDSMVWELAYSELVFLDLGWNDLMASHLELAVDDFTRRHRRFGGLDS